MKIIAVIPALNEETRIKDIVTRTINYVDKVIVIDDGSDDRTFEIVHVIPGNVIAIKHRLNLGKGATMKTGCEAAIELGADIIVLLDADGQHNPADMPRFIKKISDENLGIVFGSRKIGKDMPLMMMLGNKFLSLAISWLFGIYLSDTQGGFRAFKSSVYPKIKWNSSRYAVETEMIVKVAKNKLKYGEVEIDTVYHDNYKGTTVIDGIRIFINILIWRIL